MGLITKTSPFFFFFLQIYISETFQTWKVGECKCAPLTTLPSAPRCSCNNGVALFLMHALPIAHPMRWAMWASLGCGLVVAEASCRVGGPRFLSYKQGCRVSRNHAYFPKLGGSEFLEDSRLKRPFVFDKAILVAALTKELRIGVRFSIFMFFCFLRNQFHKEIMDGMNLRNRGLQESIIVPLIS